MKCNEIVNLYEWNIYLLYLTNFVFNINTWNPLELHVHDQNWQEAY